MPTVVGGQEDAVGLMVRRDDDPDHVRDVVLAQMLLIDPQHVRRCSRAGLHMIVMGKAIELAKITRLADPENDRL